MGLYLKMFFVDKICSLSLIRIFYLKVIQKNLYKIFIVLIPYKFYHNKSRRFCNNYDLCLL